MGIASGLTPSRIGLAFAVVPVALMVLAGCAVGPDFSPPPAPTVGRYTPEASPSTLDAGESEQPQHLVLADQSVQSDWWTRFGDGAVDALVTQALQRNPTLDGARANLAQAEQALRQARAAELPQLDLTASAQRQHGPSALLGQQPGHALPTYDLYSVGPVVSFAPDAFGGTARRIEQSSALARAKEFELAAARLSVAGNVVTQGIEVASLREQVGIMGALLKADERDVDLVRRKFDAGRAPRTDLLLAQAQWAADRALLPGLEQQLAAGEDALAVLAGAYPGAGPVPRLALDDFTLPSALPVQVPSALVRARPDIRAAESELHAANAAVGVATSEMYPAINLSASLQSAALTPGSLFQSGGTVWSLLGGLTAPIFHGGALQAQKEQALDAWRAADATYRETVLQAFGQVADVLRALEHDAAAVRDQRQALDIAGQSLDLQRAGYAAGKTDVLALLQAERSLRQARLGYVRALAQRLSDSAQLFVAMGGGQNHDSTLAGR